MPLTNKEKQRRKREKIKEDQTKYVENLEKDRKRKGASRAPQKQKMSNKMWEEFKVKERIRVRQYRANTGLAKFDWKMVAHWATKYSNPVAQQ